MNHWRGLDGHTQVILYGFSVGQHPPYATSHCVSLRHAACLNGNLNFDAGADDGHLDERWIDPCLLGEIIGNGRAPLLSEIFHCTGGDEGHLHG